MMIAFSLRNDKVMRQSFLFYQQCLLVTQKTAAAASHSSCFCPAAFTAVERNTEAHLDHTCLLKPPTPH